MILTKPPWKQKPPLKKHAAPIHPGTGTDQSVHGGDDDGWVARRELKSDFFELDRQRNERARRRRRKARGGLETEEEKKRREVRTAQESHLFEQEGPFRIHGGQRVWKGQPTPSDVHTPGILGEKERKKRRKKARRLLLDDEEIEKKLSHSFGSKRKRRAQLVRRLKRARGYKPPKRKKTLGQVRKHAAPTHPGTGTDQSVHGGGGTTKRRSTSAEIDAEVAKIKATARKVLSDGSMVFDCPRCDGQGGKTFWPGFTCFKCRGSGIEHVSAKAIRQRAGRNLRVKREAPAKEAERKARVSEKERRFQDWLEGSELKGRYERLEGKNPSLAQEFSGWWKAGAKTWRGGPSEELEFYERISFGLPGDGFKIITSKYNGTTEDGKSYSKGDQIAWAPKTNIAGKWVGGVYLPGDEPKVPPLVSKLLAPSDVWAETLAKHYGPGPHPSGSEQSVHGGGKNLVRTLPPIKATVPDTFWDEVEDMLEAEDKRQVIDVETGWVNDSPLDTNVPADPSEFQTVEDAEAWLRAQGIPDVRLKGITRIESLRDLGQAIKDVFERYPWLAERTGKAYGLTSVVTNTDRLNFFGAAGQVRGRWVKFANPADDPENSHYGIELAIHPDTFNQDWVSSVTAAWPWDHRQLVLHEMGHVVHKSLNPQDRGMVQPVAGLLPMYENMKNPNRALLRDMSIYSTESPNEFFAELFAIKNGPGYESHIERNYPRYKKLNKSAVRRLEKLEAYIEDRLKSYAEDAGIDPEDII